VTAVYVAGSSRELERAEAVIAALRSAGVHVTGDWVGHIRDCRAAGVATDAELSDDEARAVALLDLDALDRACTLLLLAPAPEAPSCGAWVELGAAYLAGLRLVISGPHARQSIFTRLGHIYDTDDEAVLALSMSDGWIR
jgi:hypothetical protein